MKRSSLVFLLLVGCATIAYEGAIDHPNWMTAAEGILNPGIVSFVERGYRFMGGKGPVWARLPELFRFMSRLGIRKKHLMRINDLLVSRTPAQLPLGIQRATENL